MKQLWKKALSVRTDSFFEEKKKSKENPFGVSFRLHIFHERALLTNTLNIFTDSSSHSCRTFSMLAANVGHTDSCSLPNECALHPFCIYITLKLNSRGRYEKKGAQSASKWTHGCRTQPGDYFLAIAPA